MSEYYMDEAAFELPGAWQDKSVHVLSTTLQPSGARVALCVSRTEAPTGAPLRVQVDRALEDQRRGLNAYELVDRQDDVVVAGLPAVATTVRFRMPEGPMHQRQVFLLANGRLLIIAATARWPDRTESDGVLETLLSSLSFRERAS